MENQLEQKKQLVRTAWELFVKYGVRRVSVLDICNELHISKKTFYLHFASKEDLVDSLMNGVDHSAEIVEAVNDFSGNVIDFIHGGAAKAQKVMEDKSAMNVLFDIEKYYPAVSARHFEKKSKELRCYAEAVLEKGLAQGVFRNDVNVELTIAIFTLLNPASFRKIGKEKLCIPKDMIDFFLRGLLNAKGLTYYEQLLEAEKTEK